MKLNKTILIQMGTVVIGSALISLLLSIWYPHKNGIVVIALVYSLSLVMSLSGIHRLVSRKLTVFSFWQSWVLRSLFYVLAMVLALVIGLAVQTAVFIPRDQVLSLLVNGLLEGVVALLTMPFTGSGQPGILAENSQRMVGLLFLLIIATAIGGTVIGYVELRWREIRNRQMIDSAELKALKAQIAPHFLFNTLNTIVSVIRPNPVQAESLLIKLSDLLRYQFHVSGKQKVTCAEEVDFTRNYLDLLQARFGDNLIINWKIDSNLNFIEVPPLILQPLIENSVRHGWQRKNEPFKIQIENCMKDGFLCMSIKDNGCGISASEMKKLPRDGHALQNIDERLQLHFGSSRLMKIESKPGDGTSVTIMIPEKN